MSGFGASPVNMQPDGHITASENPSNVGQWRWKYVSCLTALTSSSLTLFLPPCQVSANLHTASGDVSMESAGTGERFYIKCKINNPGPLIKKV